MILMVTVFGCDVNMNEDDESQFSEEVNAIVSRDC